MACRDLQKTLLFLAILLFFIISVALGEESVVVQGIGYPPIRAENSAQARLMARRAAILDGYRNAFREDFKTQDEEGGDYYLRLSGFIKGSEIIKEEYLSDGSVRVTLRVYAKEATKAVKRDKKEPSFDKKGIEGDKPKSISLEEWYKVIQGMVKYH